MRARAPFRRFRRRGQRGQATTTRWGRPNAINFRARRTGVRQWRRLIYRDTQAAAHYRSISQGVPNTTGAAIGGVASGSVYMVPALQVLAALSPFQPFHTSVFWTVAGGLRDLDFGVTPPLFKGDITLRGGIARLFIGSYPENVPLRVKVWAVWSKTQPDVDIYNAVNNTNQPTEWDPSTVPDFTTKFGKILYSKQALVPVGESFEIVHRFKPQKIDQVRFTGTALEPAGNQLWWMFQLVNLDANTLSDRITCVNSFNVSFSADAIGTT